MPCNRSFPLPPPALQRPPPTFYLQQTETVIRCALPRYALNP